jgi:peptidoglycan/xylan/chitin deacetylase (PgdA/CDA1 family)
MARAGTVYLMYHELEIPGRALYQTEQGYVRYAVSEADFRSQMAWLRAGNFRGSSVTEALAGDGKERRRVAVTFDDGYETDLLVAAPVLMNVAFGATFYMVAGFVGRRGHLSVEQLRELARLGFEIGCHSMTHRYLPALPMDSLRIEIREAKKLLENILGRRVDHFSCPGGRWDRRVARAAEEAGYRSVATSRSGVNSAADRFSLARVAILRGTPLERFGRLCRADGLAVRRAREVALNLAKVILGNSRYERWRAAALDRKGARRA